MHKVREQITNHTLLLSVMLFLGGIDGFQGLAALKELGARPFFLFAVLILLFRMLVIGRIRFNINNLNLLIGIILVSSTGFLFFGSTLEPFGEKIPDTQFYAHALLFLIGFSPLLLGFPMAISEASLIRASRTALYAHILFVAIDGVSLLNGGARPFEGTFLGSVDRIFPTGLFSEPSYLAAYVGILLPICLFRASPLVVIILSLIVSGLFLAGGVRSFFLIYAASLLVLTWLRWGVGRWTILALILGGPLLIIIIFSLGTFSAEESLSSAYRMGNTISYISHAFFHDFFVGDGFGASHFLYPNLDHPFFMFLSEEFAEMLGGTGTRVPVFNLWVRMFVEIGVIPTLIILAFIFRRLNAQKVPPIIKVYFAGSFMFTLSTDSYIYGMFWMSLFFLYSIKFISNHEYKISSPSMVEANKKFRVEGVEFEKRILVRGYDA